MKRSKNLYESLRLKTNWSPVPNDKISDEYLNYDKFNKNHTKVKAKQDSVLDDGKYVLSRNAKKLFKNLEFEGTNMADNVLWDNMVQDVYDEAKTENDAKEEVRMMEEAQDKDLRDLMDLPIESGEINLGQMDNRRYRDDEIFGRLSPHARESIYQLYLQGWTVRDLSIRFGIIPERVKAVVWMRQLFYEEVMPRVNLTTVKLGLEMEMLYNMDFPWVDYGADLALMAYREKGMLFQRFRRKDIDIKPPKEVQEKMEKVLEKKGKKKYDIVTEKFVGEAGKGYFIKSWVVYKRHGSERVNRRFKDILRFEGEKDKLPYPIQKKLHQGPRTASKGYGIH